MVKRVIRCELCGTVLGKWVDNQFIVRGETHEEIFIEGLTPGIDLAKIRCGKKTGKGICGWYYLIRKENNGTSY